MRIDELDAKLDQARAKARSEITEDLEYEVDEDDDVETDESLDQALTLIQDALMLFDDLVDQRVEKQNNISAEMIGKIHKLCSEMWVFIQPFENVEDDTVKVLDGEEIEASDEEF